MSPPFYNVVIMCFKLRKQGFRMYVRSLLVNPNLLLKEAIGLNSFRLKMIKPLDQGFKVCRNLYVQDGE